MAVAVATINPGTDNKDVGETNNAYAMGGGGPGLCGTPVWDDFVIWDDLKIWID